MKLISFAVISLLAITVSAHPGLAEQEEQEIRSVMKTIEKQLKKKDLSEDERWDLQNHYAGSVDDLKKAESALIPKKQQLEEAGDNAIVCEVKINILEENLERKTEQDAKSKESNWSFAWLQLLQRHPAEQIDETFMMLLTYLLPIMHHPLDSVLSVLRHTSTPTSTSSSHSHSHYYYSILSASSAKASKPTGVLAKTTDIDRPDQLRPTAPPPPLSRQILAVNVANISNKRPAIRHIVRNTRFWAISETCITSSKFRFTVPGFATERGEVSRPRKIFEEDRIVRETRGAAKRIWKEPRIIGDQRLYFRSSKET
ncbi:hypothetical protein BASA50_009765 [Batrachochytrium salamandrivorans]|uniref:Uncharacterized protein n=1 Tax=Batrachochytrium salamandrivorans TaxID=1357716 RepID=A0ABQ8F0B3_9FUNG|nr:hypothetical protein BASA50_009765 [Batrachochytrium salamandrivorans]